MTNNKPVDFTEAVVGETSIKITDGSPVIFSITVTYDTDYGVVKVQMTDVKSGNDSIRAITDGMVSVGISARIPVKSIYGLLPSMTEEIVVLNRLMGHVIPEPEEAQ